MMPLLLLLILLIPATAESEIYYWYDGSGKKYFSDRPQPGAQTLKVFPGNSYHSVKKVYDGDTILLSNGDKIRLLGINTPEVEGRHKTLESGGEKAKRWLQQRLQDSKIRLETDIEKKDNYGRQLAHVFTENKEHINLELIEKGYASLNIHPPNLKYTTKLLNAQHQAENERSGIWSDDQYLPKQASQIKQGRFKGWQRVLGHITHLKQTRKYNYLNFSDTFGLRIARDAESLFPNLNDYIGKKVEVRGWIHKQKKKYIMLVRHPSAIKPVSDN